MRAYDFSTHGYGRQVGGNMMRSDMMGMKDEGVIEYGLEFKLLAASSSIGVSACFIFFIVAMGLPSNPQQIGYFFLVLTIEAVAVFTIVGVFHSKYYLDVSGITKKELLIKPAHIDWNDVQCITYDEEKGFFVKGPKKRFRFEKYRTDLPFFAFMIKKYVDGYKYIGIEERIDSLSNKHLGLTSITNQEGRRKNSLSDYGKFIFSFVALLAFISFFTNESGTNYIALAIMIASCAAYAFLEYVYKPKSKDRTK